MINDLFTNRKNSVNIAKDRLELLLSSDRITCTVDYIPYIKEDLYSTLSKYIEIKEEDFDIQITRNEIHIKF